MKEAGQQFLTLQSLLFLCQGTSNTLFICFSRAVLIDQPNGGSLPSLLRFSFV